MGVTERRLRERESRRELAIDAAMAIYADEGYHAITMEKIAERSEVSRAALYLYFKNKEEIVLNAVVSYAEYFEGLLREIYEKRESIKEDLLEELWKCFRSFYEKSPVTFSAWQYLHQREMIANLSPEFRNILKEVGAKVVSVQHKIVEYAVEEKIFIPCDHRTLAEVIWSSFLGIIYTERSKNRLTQKNHMSATMDLAQKILSQGVHNPFWKQKSFGVRG